MRERRAKYGQSSSSTSTSLSPPKKKNENENENENNSTHQCDEELALIPKMAAWKPWDVKVGHTVELRIEKPVE